MRTTQVKRKHIRKKNTLVKGHTSKITTHEKEKKIKSKQSKSQSRTVEGKQLLNRKNVVLMYQAPGNTPSLTTGAAEHQHIHTRPTHTPTHPHTQGN